MIKGLVSAVRLLTIIPVPGGEPENPSAALPWFPVVGALIGGILYGVVIVLNALLPTRWDQAVSLFVLAGGSIITGGLHLDGLADWADAFGNSQDREHTLAIMKDPHIGSFGVIVLGIVFLGKWVALTTILAMHAPIVIVLACVISRTMMVDLAVRYPYARPEGGTGAGIVSNGKIKHLIGSFGLCCLIATGIEGIAGLMFVATGCLTSAALGWWSGKRIGGVTGDILGACSELVETVVLFMGALVSPH